MEKSKLKKLAIVAAIAYMISKHSEKVSQEHNIKFKMVEEEHEKYWKIASRLLT